MTDFLDFAKFIGSVLLIIALLIGLLFAGILGLGIYSEQQYCSTMQSINTEFDFRWELWGGCLVQTPNGYWINAREYKYLEGDVR